MKPLSNFASSWKACLGRYSYFIFVWENDRLISLFMKYLQLVIKIEAYFSTLPKQNRDKQVFHIDFTF
jgi:hypothetical protein